MSQTVIEVKDLCKYYRLGSIGGGTLREDINRWFARWTGRQDPAVPVSGLDVNSDNSGEIWAIRNINLEVKQGEILGIIGHNGAGKSTLLKILSCITAPTSGQMKIRGRVGSLLEVGTGFHPELTGRENIFLNGAILGMKRREIEEKLDDIVQFSEIQEFIDTPIKRYSSGMRVRLAFAVAAHLEPEILLVDEVLAVGDKSFQDKCIGKMDEVSSSGRTIIFVSHNLTSIRRLCDRLLVMKQGEIVHDGTVDAGIDRYLDDLQTRQLDMPLCRRFDSDSQSHIESIEILTQRKNAKLFFSDEPRFRIRFRSDVDYNDLELNISFWDRDIKLFMLFGSELTGRGYNQRDAFEAGDHVLEFSLPAGLFWSGTYHLNLALLRPRHGMLHQVFSAISFEILDDKLLVQQYQGIKKGKLHIEAEDVAYSVGEAVIPDTYSTGKSI